MVQVFGFRSYQKKRGRILMQLAQDQCGAKYPYWGDEKKMSKMGLVTRWLKTNLSKATELVTWGKKRM